ncbi:MAG: hypothetical protein ABSC42_04780 [Tepidisphaeraceae bacterium]|jgi:hypothetical protein
MSCLLAYAESGDPNAMNLVIILGGIGIVAATAILAFALIFTARARGHRHAEFILVAAVFWGLITVGSLMYAGEAQLNWSKEYTLRLETGYLDPQDTSDAPRLPWGIWTGLGVAYGAMMAWALCQRRAERGRG